MLFLSPLWLALSAAALVPLLLHLRRRPQGRVVEFPAARYLARATHDHERSLRAKNSLLAMLRMLLVLLLALAASRPLARIGTGHGRAAVAVVIDNSLSTGAVTNGSSVLEQEKRVARAVLADATPEDRLWLVTADRRVTGGDAATLRARLDSIRPLSGAGDLAGALRTAASHATGIAGASPGTVVATDAQATTWREVPALAPNVMWTPAARPPDNRALLIAEPRPSRWTGSGVVHLTTRGASAGDTLVVRIEIDGRTLGRGIVMPDASGVGDADVTVADPPRGWAAGRAVLAPDELAADDERWFASWNAPPPRVISRAGSFADHAVEALVSAGVIAAGNEVTIAPADGGIAKPVLAVAPLEPSRIGGANRALERAGVPWRFGAERRGIAPARGDGVAAIDVRRRYALIPTAVTAAETLATVSGEPWVVAGDGYVLVASALDTAATTLPATPQFVPWLARLLGERLGGNGRPATAIAPGESVMPPPGADGLESPDGERRAIGDEPARPTRAGVYFWTRAGARIGAVTVNGEAKESVLQRLTDGEMRQRLRPGTLTHDALVAASAAYRSASRRPLGSAVLGAVLAVLLVETLVAAAPGAWRRRAAPPTDQAR